MIDLDAVLTLAVDYEGRMQIARDFFDRSEPIPKELKQYLAPMKDIVVVKAFEALRPLVARVQELEAEADILADRIACHNKGCYCGFDVKYWRQWARERREEREVVENLLHRMENAKKAKMDQEAKTCRKD